MLTDGCPVVQSSPAACLGISPHSTVSHSLLHPQLCRIAQLTSTAPCSTAEVTHCSPLHSLLSAPLPSLSTALLPTAQLTQSSVPHCPFQPSSKLHCLPHPYSTALHCPSHWQHSVSLPLSPEIAPHCSLHWQRCVPTAHITYLTVL